MKSHPLSLIDENDDNSSQTHISSTKPKKYIKEDDISTENTLNNQKKYNFQEKYINNKKPNVNSQQRIIFDFRNKLVKENFNIMNNNKSEISSKGGLIDDTNEETKKEDLSRDNKLNMNEKIIQEKKDLHKDKLSKNLIEKRDKRFSYHGKIYFFCAIMMLIYQYISYIYFIEIPIIERK